MMPLQFALGQRRDKQGWLKIIEKMREITPSGGWAASNGSSHIGSNQRY